MTERIPITNRLSSYLLMPQVAIPTAASFALCLCVYFSYSSNNNREEARSSPENVRTYNRKDAKSTPEESNDLEKELLKSK